MSEFYGGDEEGYYDENGDYTRYNGGVGGGGSGGGGGWDWWGGAGSDGGNAGYTPTTEDLWKLPTQPTNWSNFSSFGGEPVYNTGAKFSATGEEPYDLPMKGTDWSMFAPSGTGSDYYGSRFAPTGKTNPQGPGTDLTLSPFAKPKPTNPPEGPGGNRVTNTQNNSLSQSVGLGAFSPISSGVPEAAASSFKPNVISSGGGIEAGKPPVAPLPPVRKPPTLHPEKPSTDWSKITFGAEDSAPPQASQQSAAKPPRSTLGKVAGIAGALTGIGPMVDKYKGYYESLSPPKPKTQEEMNAELYRSTYGL